MKLTVADRNLNPGNLRNVSTGEFHKFSSEGEGYAALMNDLQSKVNGTSRTGLNGDSTLYDFSSKYAPASDKNNPAQYTANLANRLKVRPDTKLSELKNRIPDFAQAIAANEGYSAAKGFKAEPQTAYNTTANLASDTNTQSQQNTDGYVNTANLVSGERPLTPPAPKKDFLQKAGDFSKGLLNFTGGNKVANLLGTELAVGLEKGKGLIGLQDNSRFIPHSADDIDPVGTALDTGRLASSLFLTKQAGNLLNKALPTSVNPVMPNLPENVSSSLGLKNAAVKAAEPLESSPAQIIQDLINVPKAQFANLSAVQKANIIQDAMNVTSKGADRIILRNALQELEPQVILESGGGSFSDYHPLISKAGGLLGSGVKNIAKSLPYVIGIPTVGGIVNKYLLPPPRQ